MNKIFEVTKERENDFDMGIFNKRNQKGNILNLNDNCCDTKTFYSFESCKKMKINNSCKKLLFDNLKEDLLSNLNVNLDMNMNLKPTDKVKMLFFFFLIYSI